MNNKWPTTMLFSSARSHRARFAARGQSLVEFALILPVLTLVIFGIIDMARVIQAQVTVNNAARQAIRFAITGYQEQTPAGDYLVRTDSIRTVAIAGLAGLPLTNTGNSDEYGFYQVEINPSDGGLPGQNVEVYVYYTIEMLTPPIRAIFPRVIVSGFERAINEQWGAVQNFEHANLPPLPPPLPTWTPRSSPTPTAVATQSPTPTVTPTPLGSTHVNTLDGSCTQRGGSFWNAKVKARTHDGSHANLGNVVVSGVWSDGFTGTGVCTTNNGGSCDIETGDIVPNAQQSIRFTVTSLIYPGYSYNSGDNHMTEVWVTCNTNLTPSPTPSSTATVTPPSTATPTATRTGTATLTPTRTNTAIPATATALAATNTAVAATSTAMAITNTAIAATATAAAATNTAIAATITRLATGTAAAATSTSVAATNTAIAATGTAAAATNTAIAATSTAAAPTPTTTRTATRTATSVASPTRTVTRTATPSPSPTPSLTLVVDKLDAKMEAQGDQVLDVYVEMKDNRGSMVSGVTVLVSASNGSDSWSGTLADLSGGLYRVCNQGFFSGNSNAISVTVTASKAGYWPATRTATAGSGNISGCPTVPRLVVDRIDAKIEAEGAQVLDVEVKIKDNQGQTVSGATVDVVASNGSDIWNGTLDNVSGNIYRACNQGEFYGGTITIIVTASKSGYATGSGSAVAGSGDLTCPTIPRLLIDSVNARMEAEGQQVMDFEVKIRDNQGQNISGATVEVAVSNGWQSWIGTLDNVSSNLYRACNQGEFYGAVGNITVSVTASKSGYVSGSDTVSASMGDIGACPRVARLVADRFDIRVATSGNFGLDARVDVKDNSGVSISGATVVVTANNASQSWSGTLPNTQTNRYIGCNQGNFNSNPSGVTVSVTISKPGYLTGYSVKLAGTGDLGDCS